MKILLLGDVHNGWSKVREIIAHEFPDSDGFAFSTGDLEKYPEVEGAKFYFVHGNHENINKVYTLWENKGNPTPIFAGDIIELEDGTRIAGLPGNYSPYFYDKDVRNKYIKKWDIEKAETLKSIDIFLSHEAPSGIGFEKFGKDLGMEFITEIIEKIKPKLAFFGHHHFYFKTEYKGTRIFGLDYPKRSYMLLETKDLSLKKIEAQQNERGSWVYEWMK